MSWEALNNLSRNYGAPAIDFDRFSQIWETDPTIQSVVSDFDENGITIQTNNQGQLEMPEPEQGSGEVSKMAKRATRRSRK